MDSESDSDADCPRSLPWRRTLSPVAGRRDCPRLLAAAEPAGRGRSGSAPARRVRRAARGVHPPVVKIETPAP